MKHHKDQKSKGGDENDRVYEKQKGTVLAVGVIELENIVEKFRAELIYKQLTTLEKSIKEIAAKYHGSYCGDLKTQATIFFDWNHHTSDEPTKTDHAKALHQANEVMSNAVDCAINIQKENANIINAIPHHVRPSLPLRVALTNGLCCLAKDGNQQLLHIIGEGVLLAHKFSELCGINSIIYSLEIAEILEKAGVVLRPSYERTCKLPNSNKHFFIEEYGVFHDDQRLQESLVKKLTEGLNGRRLDDERYKCDEELKVLTPSGSHKIINFSKGGLEVRSHHPYLHGDIISIKFENKTNTLSNHLKMLHLSNITCEVVWIRQVTKKEYALGLMFLKLNSHQKEDLVNVLLATMDKREVC